MSRHPRIDQHNRRALSALLADLLVWARPHGGDVANREFWAAWDAGADAEVSDARARAAVEALRAGRQLSLLEAA